MGTDTATAKDYYFDSYSHYGIHAEMLGDTQRTLAYRDAIKKNPELFEGKTVLDVGCGTGILSFFALQAGAKHVYAVDASDIVLKAREIATLNGFGPDRITFIHGKLEDIKLGGQIPDRVDVIISEWMGYCALYESMLDSVIRARDDFLVEGGAILPNKFQMYFATLADSDGFEDKVESWRNVYGFNYEPIRSWAVTEPVTDTVTPRNVISRPVSVMEIDIMTATIPDLDFTAQFTLPTVREAWAQGFVGWFNVDFDMGSTAVALNTSPWHKYTHWQHCLFYANDEFFVPTDSTVSVNLGMKKNVGNARDLDVGVTWDVNGEEVHEMSYKMR